MITAIMMNGIRIAPERSGLPKPNHMHDVLSTSKRATYRKATACTRLLAHPHERLALFGGLRSTPKRFFLERFHRKINHSMVHILSTSYRLLYRKMPTCTISSAHPNERFTPENQIRAHERSRHLVRDSGWLEPVLQP